MTDETTGPKRKPRAVLETGLSPDLQGRLERATDRSRSRYAPTKTAIIRRGIALALEEYDTLTMRIAGEIADADGIKADWSLPHDPESAEGKIWNKAVRVAGILGGWI